MKGVFVVEVGELFGRDDNMIRTRQQRTGGEVVHLMKCKSIFLAIRLSARHRGILDRVPLKRAAPEADGRTRELMGRPWTRCKCLAGISRQELMDHLTGFTPPHIVIWHLVKNASSQLLMVPPTTSLSFPLSQHTYTHTHTHTHTRTRTLKPKYSIQVKDPTFTTGC